MYSDLWNKTLKILSLDDRIDSVIYDTMLSYKASLKNDLCIP